MRRKSFTLVEILIVVVIMGILASVAVPIYTNVVEESKEKVCKANLEFLGTALDSYAMEHDRMPGSLSQLPREYIQRAYAKVLQEKGAWKIKLAYFILGWQERGLAYAGLLHDVAYGDLKLITCPADSTPPSEGGVSYGLNPGITANMSTSAYRALGDDAAILGDSDSTQLNITAPVARHKKIGILGLSPASKFGMAVSKKRKIRKYAQ